MAREERSERVVVEDGTGVCEVSLEGGQLMFDEDGREHSGLLLNPSPRMAAALKAHGIAQRGLLMKRALRCRETVLVVGDPLYALGDVSEGAQSVRIEKGESGLLIVSDLPESTVIQRLQIGQWLALFTAPVGLALLVPGVICLLSEWL